MTHKNFDKWDFIKIKKCCVSKDSIKKIKTQATDSKKIFVNTISNKELVSGKHKTPLQFNKTINKFLKCQNI